MYTDSFARISLYIQSLLQALQLTTVLSAILVLTLMFVYLQLFSNFCLCCLFQVSR